MTEKGKKYLSDIITAIQLIEGFIIDIESFTTYSNDLKTQSAVERQLGIIGEAVNKFSRGILYFVNLFVTTANNTPGNK